MTTLCCSHAYPNAMRLQRVDGRPALVDSMHCYWDDGYSVFIFSALPDLAMRIYIVCVSIIIHFHARKPVMMDDENVCVSSSES